ncbi:MAG: PAS domain S-box protein, partial [Anaerolineae bacterium]|nr:PAS domain S-box protein [Anaerolineae bacterium]
CNPLFARDAQISSPQEILGKSDYELSWAEHAEQYRADDLAVIESGEPSLNYEEPQSTGSSMRWLRTSKVPLRDANDVIIGVMGTYEDITERKQMRQDLAVSEARYRALAHSLPGIIVGMLDLDLRLILLDGTEVESLGLTKADIEGKLIADAFPNLSMMQVLPKLHAALAGETTVHEVTATKETYRMTHAPLTDRHGNITGVISVGVNITELKRAETALRESEARLKEAQQLGKMGNYDLNTSDNTVKWSDEVYRIFGFEVGGDITLDHYRSRVSEADFERVMALADTALLTGEPYTIEHDIFLENGVTRRVFAQGRPMEDASGERTRIFGVVQDVSERRQIEAERERLAAIVSNSSDYIAVADKDSRSLYVNPAGMQSLQIEKPEDHIGQSISFFHDDATAEYLLSTAIPIVLETGRWRGETKMKRRDGSVFPVDQIAFTLHDPAGEVYGMATICRDISEQKRTENALRESEARYAALVNQARDGVLVVQDGRLVLVNQTMAEMLGGTVEEIQGAPYVDFVAPDSRTMIAENIAARIAGNPAPSRYEAQLRRTDGTIFDAEISAAYVYLNGRPASMGLLRDITQRKRDEMALRESEQRFRGLFEQLPLGAFLTAARAEGTQAAIIVDCNEAAARMNGYTREELIGLPIDVLIANKIEVEEEVRGAFWDQVREEGFVTLDDDRLRKDGTTYPAQSTVSMLTIHDEEMLLIIERDITEARRAEAARRESERRFREVLENVQLLSVMLDTHGQVIFCNDFLLQQTGWTREDVIGHDWFELFSPDRPELREVHESVLVAGMPPQQYEEAIQTHSGETLTINWNSTYLRDEQGNVVGVVNIGENVTEKLRAQQDLEASEERFRGLFEQLPMAAFLAAPRHVGSPAAIIIDCNEAALCMNGYTREELIGQPIDMLLADPYKPDEAKRRWYWEEIRKRTIIDSTAEHVRKDGTIYPTQSILSRMEIQGEATLMVIVNDITESKRAEKALRDSEVRFRTLFEKLPLGVTLVVPRGGNIPGEIIDCNAAAAAMHGYRREELIGQPIDILTAESVVKAPPGYAMLDAVRSEGTISYELLHRHKDGTFFPVEGSATSIDIEGVEALMGIDRDITDRKRAQEERETMIAELETKNAELERFTYTVSH